MIRTLHPNRPPALQPPTIKFEVVTEQVTATWNKEIEAGKRPSYTLIALTWEDYLTLGAYFKDIGLTFDKYGALLCYYRKELNEEQCKPYAELISEKAVEVSNEVSNE